MKKVNQLAQLDKITRQAVKENKAESSGRKSGQSESGRDHVDAINQMFAEFELAFHNQYRKAFPDEGSLNLAKKYWLNCLSPFSPELILRAARQLVLGQPYLPTVANMVDLCKNGMSLYGLPSAHDAYLEACRAPSPKSAQEWTHPAVFLAGRATGWFELGSQPEAQIYPLFEHHYSQLMQKVLDGEELDIDAPTPIPQELSTPLSNEENQSRLQVLKKALKF